ncbi:hypothetical protein GCM10022243_50390 [Saccharothrix violaceirubra]|uniref:Short-subunit dehydrogenase n=1 Tax=Saccharothrix violaceirubra TaxID=413306 RepID=A0A7W7WTY0_9PSEU|nr:hypothetical protein [Saccharothrix violaceirubra]MBB4963619.1 short-subunit dehydrogenase [Saccharothrix violaceirubra]
MNKWQRIAVVTVLLAEVAVTLLPIARTLSVLDELTNLERQAVTVSAEDRTATEAKRRHAPRVGVRVATITILMVTAGVAAATVLARPRSRSWLGTFAGTRVAVVGLAWSYGLPAVAALAGVSLVAVSTLVLMPGRPRQ